MLRDILGAIHRLTALDEILMKPERPTQLDGAQLMDCCVSVDMLGKMAEGIISYTDGFPETSIRHLVDALKEGFSRLGGKTSSVMDNEEYARAANHMHFEILFVIEVARKLMKELLPKGLSDTHYSLRSVERTLEYGELPLTKYLRRLDLSDGGP